MFYVGRFDLREGNEWRSFTCVVEAEDQDAALNEFRRVIAMNEGLGRPEQTRVMYLNSYIEFGSVAAKDGFICHYSSQAWPPPATVEVDILAPEIGPATVYTIVHPEDETGSLDDFLFMMQEPATPR